MALPPKPRDFGLLLNALVYRVPVENEITDAVIEKWRVHCRMKAERLIELRKPPHDRHWPRMYEKRRLRLEWFKEHGKMPQDGWYPGQPKRCMAAILGFKEYRQKLAPLKSKIRRRPEAQVAKLTNLYKALDDSAPANRKDLEARYYALVLAQSGKLTLEDYRVLEAAMIKRPSRRKRKRGQYKYHRIDISDNACAENLEETTDPSDEIVITAEEYAKIIREVREAGACEHV